MQRPPTGGSLSFTDRAFATRIGWREITVSARDGARLVDASVPGESRSDELRAYPGDLLSSPLDVRSADAHFDTRQHSCAGRRPQGHGRLPAHPGGGFEALIERGDLSGGRRPALVARRGLLGSGARAHAGAREGARGRIPRGHARDAPATRLALGATVTVTHTAGVFALGLVTLLLSRFIVPEQLYPWLTLALGLLVVAVGLGVLRLRLRGRAWPPPRSPSRRSRPPPPRSRARSPPRPRRRPCADVTRHPRRRHRGRAPPVPVGARRAAERDRPARVGFGMALIVAFSLGLAPDDHRHRPARGPRPEGVLARPPRGPVVRALPAVSAAVIVLVGLAITVKAVPGVA